MTELEIKRFFDGIAVSQAKTDRQMEAAHKEMAEAGRQFKETDRLLTRQIEDTTRRHKELEAFLNQVGKEVREFSQGMGSFAEGMAFPALEKILRGRFGMKRVAFNVSISLGGRNIELDAVGSSDEVDKVYVVEVKSHLKDRGIRQMLRTLEAFTDFFPEHRGKELFGILAAVRASDETRRQVLKKGIYFARTHEDSFQIVVPEDFRPRAFPL